MFEISKFNQNISKWNVSQVKYMNSMFADSVFNQDISHWNVSNVIHMFCMFVHSQFNQNIDVWKINPQCDIDNMFFKSKMEKLPTWYKMPYDYDNDWSLTPNNINAKFPRQHWFL